MHFHFDDDDEDKIPIEDIAKFLEKFQKDIFKQLQNSDFDMSDILKQLQNSDLYMSDLNNNPNVKKFGFSIHMGPDGKPHIAPIGNNNNIPFNPNQNKKQGNGFEDPFTDVFYFDEKGEIQVIAEVQGIPNEDHVHLKVDGNDLKIHAESGPYKYKKSMLVKHELDPDTLNYTVRNGVLEINATIKQ